jgi:hypothetical protein
VSLAAFNSRLTVGRSTFLIIEFVFGADIDYGWEIKDYGTAEESRERYSPSRVKAVKREIISGRPDKDLITTAHVERKQSDGADTDAKAHALGVGFFQKEGVPCRPVAVAYLCL